MKKIRQKNNLWFAGAWICIFASNLFAVTLQFLKGDVLDQALLKEAGKTAGAALLLIVMILCETGFYFCFRLFQERFVTGCTGCLKQEIFRSTLNRNYISYREKQTGEYLAKYTNEADTVRSRYLSMQLVFWDIFLKVVFVGAALFILNVRIAVVTFVLLTMPLYVPKLIEKKLVAAQEEYLEAVKENLAAVNDWLSGMEVIKNFSLEAKIMERFGKSCSNMTDRMWRDGKLGAVSQLLTTLISYLSYFIVLVCAAWLVVIGEFSAGDFFVAVGMIDQLSYPLISLAEVIRQLIAVRPACAEIESFLGSAETERDGLQGFGERIEFSSVSFSYDKKVPVLRDFDLAVEKGKRYLLKGPSGCGKTTAVNLLLRYYDADRGSLTVDGQPIERWQNTYACMTVVRQEAVLFCDTLRNNLTMYEDIPDDTLIALLHDVGLDKYADKESLDSVIAENGSNLSGGEKKRICFARAMLRNTDVLILDEPLANLDEETAGKIEDLILSLKERTVLVVSHQFTKEKTALFDKVVELGTAG